MPNPAQPVLHPGTGRAGRAGRPRATLSDGADHAGGQRGSGDRDSRGDPRPVQPLASDAALPGAPARAGGGNEVAHLLQVRRRQPTRQPQAEHRRGAGVLQQAGGPDAALDRDRCRSVGERARVRVPADRARVQGVHGSHLVRAEAVSALDDSAVGRGDRREPFQRHPEWARDPRRVSRHARQPRDRDLGSRRGRGAARRHLVLARQRAQPRAPAPDGDRPGGDRADGAGRRLSRRRHRLRRRRLELRRAGVPVHPREDRRPRHRRARVRACGVSDA